MFSSKDDPVKKLIYSISKISHKNVQNLNTGASQKNVLNNKNPSWIQSTGKVVEFLHFDNQVQRCPQNLHGAFLPDGEVSEKMGNKNFFFLDRNCEIIVYFLLLKRVRRGSKNLRICALQQNYKYTNVPFGFRNVGKVSNCFLHSIIGTAAFMKTTKERVAEKTRNIQKWSSQRDNVGTTIDICLLGKLGMGCPTSYNGGNRKR